MEARGKICRLAKHAYEGMRAERPVIDLTDVLDVLQEPDSDDGHTAFRRTNKRTIIIRYSEYEDNIYVRSVSATHSDLPTKVS